MDRKVSKVATGQPQRDSLSRCDLGQDRTERDKGLYRDPVPLRACPGRCPDLYEQRDNRLCPVADHSTAHLIDRARQLLQPSPVELHHVPNWLRRQILRTLRGGPDRPPRYCTGGLEAFQHAISVTRTGSAFDHWGSMLDGDGLRVFVSEPYLSIEGVKAAERFAERFELELSISSNSWWFPGQTTRLIFRLAELRRSL